MLTIMFALISLEVAASAAIQRTECQLVDDVSFLATTVQCKNVTLRGPIVSDSVDASETFFDTPAVALDFVDGLVDKSTFQRFSQVKSLRIYSSRLARFEPKLDTLQSLRVIESDVKIDNFDLVTNNLLKLKLSNSTGFDVHLMFSNLTRLRSLHIAHIDVSCLTNEIFQNLKSLKILKLEALNLSKIDENAFLGLNKLKELYLEDDVLEKLPRDIFKPLTNLRTLVVAGKNLQAMPLDMFTEQKHLSEFSWPLNTWQAVDVDRIPQTFPSLHSVTHYRVDDINVKRKIIRLNRMIAV